MRHDVVTIGDVTRDIFVFPAENEMEKPLSRDGEKFLLFEHGDKITISDIHYDIGGAAGNVAVGLSKLGLSTGILSSAGHDQEGEEIIAKLNKAKVDTTQLTLRKDKKTSFGIIISYQTERTILVFQSFRPEDFVIPKELETNWIYLGPLGEDYRKLYAQITGLAAEKNLKIALNPGSIQLHDGLNALAGLLRVTKILFINREEGEELIGANGVTNIREIINQLLKTGVEIIVVTDGKDGAYVATKEEFFKIGTYPAERKETTGAGDAFAAAYLASYIKNNKLFDCLKWGAVNSASVIEKVGAQEGLLSTSTIKKRMSEYRWPAESLRFSR